MAYDSPPADHDKGEAFPDSSNASTLLKSGSDTASSASPRLKAEPDGDVANEKALPRDKPDKAREITGVKWILVVGSILSSTFLFALDNTVVADVEERIVERFGQIQKLPWLPIAFLVSAVSTNSIWYATEYAPVSNCH